MTKLYCWANPDADQNYTRCYLKGKSLDAAIKEGRVITADAARMRKRRSIRHSEYFEDRPVQTKIHATGHELSRLKKEGKALTYNSWYWKYIKGPKVNKIRKAVSNEEKPSHTGKLIGVMFRPKKRARSEKEQQSHQLPLPEVHQPSVPPPPALPSGAEDMNTAMDSTDSIHLNTFGLFGTLPDDRQQRADQSGFELCFAHLLQSPEPAPQQTDEFLFSSMEL